MQLERRDMMVKTLIELLVFTSCGYVIINRICTCIERIAFFDKIDDNSLDLEDFRDGKK